MEAQTEEAITPQPKQGQWVRCHQGCAQSRQAGAWLAMGEWCTEPACASAGHIDASQPPQQLSSLQSVDEKQLECLRLAASMLESTGS